MKFGLHLSEKKDKYVVSNKDMKKGYWKVINVDSGETIKSGFSTKLGAQTEANGLNKNGLPHVSGKYIK